MTWTRWRRRRETGPAFEPWLDQFRDGLAVLLRDGEPVGHVASVVRTFRTLWDPTPKPWVWLVVVVWADGRKEHPEEDYPPWSSVAEMRAGFLERGDGERYDVRWVPPERALDERRRLGIRDRDF